MAITLRDLLSEAMNDLRIQPVQQRVRGYRDDILLVDSDEAVLVWEPRRVLPVYAVPSGDVHADLIGSDTPTQQAPGGPVVLPPTPFTAHTTQGTPLTLRYGDQAAPDAAFAPDDPDLAGRVLLDPGAFSRWLEEEQEVIGHPKDPFHRIDCMATDRHVVVSVAGQVVADTRRSVLLVEPPLPVRYYLPVEDARSEVLVRTATDTVCPYKGHAAYWSVQADGQEAADVAWSYEEPLNDAVPVGSMLCFDPTKAEVLVDGVPAPGSSTR